MRIFAISDLHVDYSANWQWVENLSRYDYQTDVLLVAGDISHALEKLERALDALRQRFGRVFFVPGNHDVWVRGQAVDSLEKLAAVCATCSACGVDTAMAELGGVRIAPLLSWYSVDFDPRIRKAEEGALSAWGDFRYCRWPDGVEPLDRHFCAFNEVVPCGAMATVSFSHFLPRWELLPTQAYLRFKGLPLVAGSALIEGQVRALGSSVHVFGHSHIPCDIELEGVRYVQQPLAYPRERRGRTVHLKQVL